MMALRSPTPRWSKATETFTAPSRHACPQRERASEHVVHAVAELLEHGASRGGGAEVLDRDRVALVADPLPPAERNARLDREPRPDLRRDHLVTVLGRLRLEELPARHRDHAGPHLLQVELLR